MPKVFLRYNLDSGHIDVLNEETWDSVPVEMNNSLYRQIRAAEKRYHSFQNRLNTWYDQTATGQRKRIAE